MTRHGAALLALSIVASAGWAYNVNYDTRSVLDRLSGLRAEIAAEREGLQVLRVEWAYLNAPDRLADLVAAHNDVLGLVPLVPEALGEVAAIPYPPRAPEAAPPTSEALIAAAPAAPAAPAPLGPSPVQLDLAAASAGAPSATAVEDGSETMTVAMRSEPRETRQSAEEAVPPMLEAAIAAALVEVGVPIEASRPGAPHDGVIAVPSDGMPGAFAVSAPGVPLPVTRPIAWSRP